MTCKLTSMNLGSVLRNSKLSDIWRHWVFIKVTGTRDSRVETKVITYSLPSRVSHLAAKTLTTTPKWRLKCSQVRANRRCIALKQLPALLGVTCFWELQGEVWNWSNRIVFYPPLRNNFISLLLSSYIRFKPRKLNHEDVFYSFSLYNILRLWLVAFLISLTKQQQNGDKNIWVRLFQLTTLNVMNSNWFEAFHFW